jgi:putative transposase
VISAGSRPISAQWRSRSWLRSVAVWHFADTRLRYTDTLTSAGALPSIGSIGDSYDNAMAESTIGQIKTELIHRHGPWRTIEQLEYALFEYIDWWNHRRLHTAIGMYAPTEIETTYYAQTAF